MKITQPMCCSVDVEEPIVKDVNKFVQTSNQPGTILHDTLQNLPENQKKELESQLKTFPTDVKKMNKGEMTYAEMRMMYG